MTTNQEKPVKNEIDAICDDLLSRWHSWRNNYTHERGYSASDSTCRDAQSAYHYHDRSNGSVDAQIERQIMEGVDRAIDRIPDRPRPWHMLILIEARNLWSGHAVWHSARLPESDTEDFKVLRIEARNKLIVELHREGCVGG
jgi:hypothetical protein